MSFREKSAWVCLVITLAVFVRVAYCVLVTTCLLAGFGMFVLGGLSSVPALASSLQAYLLMSQVLLFCIVLAETAQYLTQVVSYRRGS